MTRTLTLILLCAVFLAAPLAAFPASTGAPGDSSDARRCLMCGSELVEADVQHHYRGRRFGLCAGDCAAEFTADPRPHLARLGPRGALLQEDERLNGPVPRPWFWFGVYVLAGLLCAGVSAYVAVNRAQPPYLWFFAGFFGNVVALLAVVALLPRGDSTALPAGIPGGLRRVPLTRSPVRCPACGHHNHPAAGQCGGCRAGLSPTAPAEVDLLRGEAR